MHADAAMLPRYRQLQQAHAGQIQHADVMLA